MRTELFKQNLCFMIACYGEEKGRQLFRDRVRQAADEIISEYEQEKALQRLFQVVIG